MKPPIYLKLSTLKLKSTLILFLLLPLTSPSQNPPSFNQIDSLSYNAYLASDWKKVLQYSNQGFNAGYDYYFLRMRAGLAELNRKFPVRAAKHFRKALAFSANDPYAVEYLYSSLLFSGDWAESRLLAADSPPEIRKKIGIADKRLISSAFVETGYMFNPNADSIKAYQPDAELSHLYMVPSYWYLSAGINLEAGKRFSAVISTNIISFTAIQQFLIPGQASLIYDVPFDQRAIYLAGSYYVGNGFHLTLAGQALSYTLPLYIWEPGDAGGQYVQNAFTYTDLAFNLAIRKRFPWVAIGLAADFNRFKNLWYRQEQADFTLYPSGNVNTWLKLEGTLLSDSISPSGRMITHASVGRKIWGKLWIEGDYYYGDIRNFSEQNAYVVFTNFDKIKKRMGINLLAYKIIPHLDLSFRYQYTLRSASWQTYLNSEYIGDQFRDYPVHSIIGGLTWQF